jgi:hypothetical protein
VLTHPTIAKIPQFFRHFQKILMANEFDPYREALVMEATTIWPEEYDDWEPEERHRIELQLHSDPAKATQLEYIRTFTGFQRQISVTPADIKRLT